MAILKRGPADGRIVADDLLPRMIVPYQTRTRGFQHAYYEKGGDGNYHFRRNRKWKSK